MDIRIQLLHDGQPYRPNGNNTFDSNHVWKIASWMQERYKDFADKINSENGYLEINLSHSTELANGIHYEVFVKGISKDLNEEIEQSIPSDY